MEEQQKTDAQTPAANEAPAHTSAADTAVEATAVANVVEEEVEQKLHATVEKDTHHEARSTGPLSEADWVAVSFVIFVALMAKFVWPKLAGFIDARSNKIADDLKQAAALKKEAEAILAAAKKKAADTEKAAEEMVANAKAESKRVAAAAEAEMNEDTERKLVLVKQKIARAEQQAIESVKKQAVEEAAKIAEKLLTSSIAKGNKQKDLLAESITQITKNIN
jgi:F-type H+-transporting ATPase subunit b